MVVMGGGGIVGVSLCKWSAAAVLYYPSFPLSGLLLPSALYSS